MKIYPSPVALAACILILGCVTSGIKSVDPYPVNAKPPIPPNSATMLPKNGPYWIGTQVYERVKKNMAEQYGCSQFTVDKVEYKGDKDLAINKEGRLLGGTIDELWYMTVCGAQRTVEVLVVPDGKGGVVVGVSVPVTHGSYRGESEADEAPKSGAGS